MKIIVTGGCGYIGTELTKFLLKKNFVIKVIDTQWFGNYLPKHKNLLIIKKDIRNITSFFSFFYTGMIKFLIVYLIKANFF